MYVGVSYPASPRFFTWSNKEYVVYLYKMLIMMELRQLKFYSLLFIALFICNALSGQSSDNEKTFKFAIIKPAGNFGQFKNGIGQPDSAGMIQYQQLSASVGFGGQFGNMYNLGYLKDGGTMKVGIDVTWFGFSYQRVKYGGGIYPYFPGRIIMQYITAFFEVGPYVSYALSESTAIDFSFKLTPTFSFIGGGDTHDVGPLEGENWFMGVGHGMRYTPAFYFHYNNLITGAEFSLGDLKFNYNVQDYARKWPSEYSKGKSPYSTLRIVLGWRY